MRLIGLMPIRNEQWIAGLSLRVALSWCDGVVVLLHACADSSAHIVESVEKESPGKLWIIEEIDAKWEEMRHRQRMLDYARQWGATHIALVDCDEVLTGNLLARVRGLISGLETGKVLWLPGYNLRGGIHQYHASGIWADPWFSTAFRDDSQLYWGGSTFHHREPMGIKLSPEQPIAQGFGGVLHFWGASEKRLEAKHRLYRCQERVLWPDKPADLIERMYSMATKGRPEARDTPKTWQFKSVPKCWLDPYEQWMCYLDLEMEPWQNREVDRLIAEHGPRYFEGLDLTL